MFYLFDSFMPTKKVFDWVALGYLSVLQTHDTRLCYTPYFYVLTANGLDSAIPAELFRLPDETGVQSYSKIRKGNLLGSFRLSGERLL